MNQNKETSSKRQQPMAGPRGSRYIEKAQDFKGTMKKLAVYLKPFRFKLMAAAIFAMMASLVSVLGPWLLGLITSEVADAFERDPGNLVIGSINIVFGISLSLIGLVVLIAGIYVVAGILHYLQTFMLIGMTQSLTYQMRRDLSAKLNRLPLKYFDNQSFGDLLGRVTNDVETINQTLTQSLSEIFRAFALLTGIFVMMFLLSPILAGVVVVTTIVSLFVARYFVKLSQGYFRKQAKSYGQLTGHIEETYSGQTVVKIFNHQEKSFAQFDQINKDLHHSSVRSQFISGIMFPVQFFIGNIAYILVAAIGALLVLSGNPLISIRVGVIQTFIQYTRQINQPIQSLGSVANVLQSTAAAAERIFGLLNAEEESPERDDLKVLDHVKGHVEFKDVHFGYSEDTEVIKGFSALIRPGQKVAIVGPTGAGKTTIVNLLMRFYEIKSGAILIDGIDIRDMRRADVRSLFGMVLQDTWLIEDTIYENIRYGSLDRSIIEIQKAAKSAQTHHFIESLPDGYQFMLSENGLNVSQGQRQLLTISRAMLADRPMLILDEATSSVDTRTEVLIQRAMEKLMEGRTSFVIAHRLSTIKDADVIFVMDDGNIVEQGTHSELLEKDGFYARLYRSQFDAQ